jgi:hypothetical protein
LLALVTVVLVGDGLRAVVGLTSMGAVIGFGRAAHLLGDAGSNRGAPLFWPLCLHVRPPLTFSTATWEETLVLVGAVAVCAWWAM